MNGIELVQELRNHISDVHMREAADALKGGGQPDINILRKEEDNRSRILNAIRAATGRSQRQISMGILRDSRGTRFLDWERGTEIPKPQHLAMLEEFFTESESTSQSNSKGVSQGSIVRTKAPQYFYDLAERTHSENLEVCVSIAYSHPPRAPGTELETALKQLLDTGHAVFNMCVPVIASDSPGSIPLKLWIHQKETEEDVRRFYRNLTEVKRRRNCVNMFVPAETGPSMALSLPLTPIYVAAYHRQGPNEGLIEKEVVAWSLLPQLERWLLKLASSVPGELDDQEPAREYLNLYEDYFGEIWNCWRQELMNGTLHDADQYIGDSWLNKFKDGSALGWKLAN